MSAGHSRLPTKPDAPATRTFTVGLPVMSGTGRSLGAARLRPVAVLRVCRGAQVRALGPGAPDPAIALHECRDPRGDPEPGQAHEAVDHARDRARVAEV